MQTFLRVLTRLPGRSNPGAAKLVADLQASIAAWPAALSAMEQLYLAMYDRLQQLLPVTNELVASAQRLTGYVSGRDTGKADIQGALEAIEQTLSRLAEADSNLGSITGGMEDIAARIAPLSSGETEMAAAMRPLHYIQVMLRIESSFLTAEQQQSFTSLTAEIAALSERAAQSCGHNLDALTKIDRFLHGALSDLERKQLVRGEELRLRREQIQAALTELSGEIDKNANRQLGITAASAGLAGCVSQAVVALQSHDIVSQRLEHTREALLETVALGAANLKRSSRSAAFHALLSIGLQQLDDIRCEIESSVKAIRTAAENIDAHLRAFDATGAVGSEFSEVTDSVSATVRILLDSFNAVRGLIMGASAHAHEVETLVRPCESVLRQLTDTAEEVSHLMLLIALNVQIQAIRTGTGTGLEVLGAHASAISTRTADIGQQLQTQVDSIANGLKANLNRVECVRANCDKQKDELSRGSFPEEQSLHAYRAETIAEACQLGAALSRARQLGLGLTELTSSNALVNSVAATRSLLLELLNSLPDRRTHSAPQLEALLARARSSYTMLGEREAHDQALLLTGAVVSGECLSRSAAATEPDLWGDCGANQANALASEVLAEGVELF